MNIKIDNHSFSFNKLFEKVLENGKEADFSRNTVAREGSQTNANVTAVDVENAAVQDTIITNMKKYLKYMNVDLSAELKRDSGEAYIQLVDESGAVVKKISLARLLAQMSIVDESI